MVSVPELRANVAGVDSTNQVGDSLISAPGLGAECASIYDIDWPSGTDWTN